MPGIHVRLPDESDFSDALDELRVELGVPSQFPDDVLSEVDEAIAAGPRVPDGAPVTAVEDRVAVALITIDPPESLDLDQAYAAARTPDGFRVHYAIADVAAFVIPGGSVDREAQARGVTLYAPDHNTLLHPPQLAEGAASLLPGETRQAVLWTIDLDHEARLVTASAARAQVRSREKISYRTAQQRIDEGSADNSLALLAEIGGRRQALEAERGAVSLNLPAQEVRIHDDHFDLEYDETLAVEGWNAQISLLTGMAAAEIMLAGKVGVLRTLPEPSVGTIDEIRRSARALGLEWPEGVSYPDRVRGLHPSTPEEAAFLNQAARGLRGAGYVTFVGSVPEYTRHAAIAAEYAHVTAPLRRVCDRFANEVVLALCGGHEPPAWAVEALEDLPSVMGRARSADRALEQGVVDLAESLALQHRQGDTFEGVVVNVDDRRAKLQLHSPAVVAMIEPDGRQLGEHVTVRLSRADPETRSVHFTVV
ncbi:MAG: RNB domain-containing ribonuclease [Acidimicrobiales bacterium]